jgi:hypothetical protein
MLNAMRMGQLDDKTIDAFQKLSRPLHFADGIETTDLYVRLLGSRSDIAHSYIAGTLDATRSTMPTHKDWLP